MLYPTRDQQTKVPSIVLHSGRCKNWLTELITVTKEETVADLAIRVITKHVSKDLSNLYCWHVVGGRLGPHEVHKGLLSPPNW